MKEIDNSENIILGSGDLYIVEFNDAVPEDATIEIDDNRAGNIKGGATLEYISEVLNFQSPSYFCRIFKKKFGITPGGYRAAK